MSKSIKKVTPKHRRMMEEMVFNGLTPREVSKIFDITETRLSIIRKSPLWVLEERELRAQFRSDSRKRMESLVPKAIDALEEVTITAAQPTARVSAAKEILNRGGMPANLVIEDTDKNNSETLYDTLKSIREEKAKVLEELGVSNVDDLIEGASISEEEGSLDTIS